MNLTLHQKNMQYYSPNKQLKLVHFMQQFKQYKYYIHQVYNDIISGLSFFSFSNLDSVFVNIFSLKLCEIVYAILGI